MILELFQAHALLPQGVSVRPFVHSERDASPEFQLHYCDSDKRAPFTRAGLDVAGFDTTPFEISPHCGECPRYPVVNSFGARPPNETGYLGG